MALEGPASVAALVLESIPGTAGIMPPPPGYLAGVRELCDRHGIILIADEVMAGFGRAGRWFAFERYEVVPDLITFAKGVNSGYVPLGGVVISEPVAATFDDRVYPGGLTYSGHPLACGAAVATIETMRDEGIVENADRLGREVFGPALAKLADAHPAVGGVRGVGAFWAIELVRDRATREPLAPYGASSEAMDATVAACKAEGLLPFANYNRIHVVPPLNISDEDAHRGLEILDQAHAVADGYVD
jgi:taurine--2-oxoglutarate transaminase